MDLEPSLKQKAYQFIRSRIVSCAYLPDTFLNEKELMEEIGVSRTPIREALSKLEQENLVTILPKRGVAIKGLSAVEINQIFQTRELIETHMIEKDGALIQREQILTMQARMTGNAGTSDLAEIYQLDDDFHKLLISGSSNFYLLQVLDHMYAQNHRMRILSGRRNVHRLERSQAEHLTIIEFLLAGEYANAAEADRIHLGRAKDAALASFINK